MLEHSDNAQTQWPVLKDDDNDSGDDGDSENGNQVFYRYLVVLDVYYLLRKLVPMCQLLLFSGFAGIRQLDP